MDIYDITAKRNGGETQSLRDYQGQVLLIVNTASRCGFTPQYQDLQALQDRFGAKGFSVLAFPCDQFGHQEPGDNAEILSFCQTRYAATFPIFEKIDVNGAGAHPLFTHLKSKKGGLLGSGIKWNFTKFLVGKDGTVLDRYAPSTSPDAIAPDIEAALK